MPRGFGVEVAAPPFVRAPYGLLDSSFEPTDPDVQRWQAGMLFVPRRSSYLKGAAVPLCVDVNDGDIDPEDPFPIVYSEMFSMMVPVRCEAKTGEELYAKARAVLADSQSKILETHFCDNPGAADTPHLTDVTSLLDLSGGVQVSAVRGLQILTQYLAHQGGGGIGMIHATPATVFALELAGVLKAVNGAGAGKRRYTTTSGHVVVNGQGYTGNGPGAVPEVDPNHHWMYATSPVVTRIDSEVRFTGETLAQSTNRGTNVSEVRAWQDGAAYWNTNIHAGLVVDTSILAQ